MQETFALADDYISNLRRERRQPDCKPDRRIWIEERIDLIETKQDEAARDVRDKLADIRASSVEMETDILDSLSLHGSSEHLYTVHWTTNTGRRPRPIRFPLEQEEIFSAGVSEYSVAMAREEAKEETSA